MESQVDQATHQCPPTDGLNERVNDFTDCLCHDTAPTDQTWVALHAELPFGTLPGQSRYSLRNGTTAINLIHLRAGRHLLS